MTQEDKNILLKDLCGRLTYGVKVWYPNGSGAISIIKGIVNGICYFNEDPRYGNRCPIESVKPYLRPLSSMTDKENEELKYVIELGLQALENEEGHNTVSAAPAAFEIDFYNKHHFDYRGLIPMELALKAPAGMYKTK